MHIVSLFLLKIIICQISVPFKITKNNIQIKLKLGEINEWYYKNIHLIRDYSWILSSSYFPEKSSTSKVLDSLILGFSEIYSSNPIIEDELFIFKNDQISVSSRINFVLLRPERYPGLRVTDGLTMCLSPKKEYSLIHQLHHEKKISKLSFGFYPVDDKNGFFHLGQISNSTLEKNNLITTCSSKKFSDWGCRLDKIEFKPMFSFLPTGKTVNFNSNMKELVLPKFYVASYFETFIKGGCKEKNQNKKTWVVCPKQHISKFNVTFTLEKGRFSFPSEELFECVEEKCTSIVISDENSKDEVIFGTHFLMNFISVFDYEAQRISFYEKGEKRSFQFVKRSIATVIIVITILNSIFIICGKFNWFRATFI